MILFLFVASFACPSVLMAQEELWMAPCGGETLAEFHPDAGTVLSDDAAAAIAMRGDATLDFRFAGQNAELEVAARSADWTRFSHLCVSLRGRRDNPHARVSVVVRGQDARGRPASAWASFDDFANLPVARPLRIDVRALVPLVGSLSLATVSQVAIGVGCARGCESPVALSVSALVGERFGDSRPLSPPERVTARPQLASFFAERLGEEVEDTCGPLLGERAHDPRRFLYTNAMVLTALHVEGLNVAAAKMSAALLALQRPDGAICDVATEVRCGVLEAAPDCRVAVGSMAWAGVALLLHRRITVGVERDRIDHAVTRLKSYLVAEQRLDGTFTRATEGDISAWLFLRRFADARDATERVARAIEGRFDPRDGYLLKGDGDYVPALDVAGNLGVYFLRERGREEDAARSAVFARSFFATRSFDGSARGFGDLGAFTINAEWGVAQYAVFGGIDAEVALSDFLAQHVPGGVASASSDDFHAGPLIVNHTRPSWVATAWLVHALRANGFP